MPHHYYRDEYDCEVLLDQVVPVGIVVVGNRRDRQVVQVEINPEHGEGQKRTAEGNEIQKKNRSEIIKNCCFSVWTADLSRSFRKLGV